MDTVTLEIPSTRNDQEMVRLLRLELALAIYREGKLSPGRAAELAGIGRWEFSDIAKSRGVATPYTPEMVQEDFARGSDHLRVRYQAEKSGVIAKGLAKIRI